MRGNACFGGINRPFDPGESSTQNRTLQIKQIFGFDIFIVAKIRISFSFVY